MTFRIFIPRHRGLLKPSCVGAVSSCIIKHAIGVRGRIGHCCSRDFLCLTQVAQRHMSTYCVTSQLSLHPSLLQGYRCASICFRRCHYWGCHSFISVRLRAASLEDLFFSLRAGHLKHVCFQKMKTLLLLENP